MTDAPERLNLRKCLGGGWSSFDDDHGTEYIRADLAHPRVKPLVWEHNLHWRWKGKPPGWGFANLCTFVIKNNGVFFTGDCKTPYKTLEAAQAAAQADYERRIFEALE